MALDALPFHCPWCGEENRLALDPQEAGQVLVQDCRVCCRPVELVHDADGSLQVRREDD